MSAPARPAAFEASTPHGLLRLTLPPGVGEAPDALGAALLLGRCEGLLLALEAWLGLALDPVPLVHTSDAEKPALTATVCSAALAPAGTRLVLPWPLAAAAAHPLPQALKHGALSWAPLAFEVELARYTRAPLPRAALPGGGMLLLPPSFERPWRVRLLQRSLAIELSASWRGPGSDIEAAGPARALAPDEGGAWRVAFAAPLQLSPLHLLARDAADRDAPPPPRPAADCAAALFEPAHSTAVARGVVTAALQGAGLWIAASEAMPA